MNSRKFHSNQRNQCIKYELQKFKRIDLQQIKNWTESESRAEIEDEETKRDVIKSPL